jgi:serine/threonine protein kinase
VKHQPGKRVMITPKKAENPEYKGIIKKQRRSLKIEDFELGKNIGSGKFGDVFQCRHKKTGTLYALKKIFKSMVLEYGMIDQFTQ